MKKVSEIFKKIKEQFHSDEFKIKHRLSESNFSRNCILNFKNTLLMIINLIKKSVSQELDDFCEFLKLEKRVSKSAFCKARKKLSPKAIEDLNNTLVTEFYLNNTIKKSHGLNVFAIDGSTLQLPDSKELLLHFGYTKNKSDQIVPMCKISQMYDVNNGIVIDAKIVPYRYSERDLAFIHLKNFIELRKHNKDLENSVILFDRGYPS